ncbi:MAG TPA: hypothetical protein VF712_20135 [Thermoleophilaceae bacterium]
MDREASDLYGLPLDEFVPARTALERRLRKEGERERAGAVKKLPKPSLAAWAVNQVSRTQPKQRRELLAASTALRETQERLVAGDASAADLEPAASRQRAAIDSLVDAAAGLLSTDGKPLGDATLGRVRETFAAVAADDELAELVEAGTLDRERQATGLGFGFGGPSAEPASPAPEAPARPRQGKAAKTSAAEKRAAQKRQRELEAARERAKAAKAAEREAAKRERSAARQAGKAAEELERAEAAVAEARDRAEAARAELEAATVAHEEAAQARESAEAAVAEARDG